MRYRTTLYDFKGRLTVAVCRNMDLGESEKLSALGFRIGVDHVIYYMKH